MIPRHLNIVSPELFREEYADTDTIMLDLIRNNPYRRLGVLANSPTRKRSSNLNHFRAFARVGRTCTSEVDYGAVIGDLPCRSEESLEKAQRELNLPVDSLKHALFWLACDGELDKAVMKKLAEGDLERAQSIATLDDNWTTLLNLHTTSLMADNMRDAAVAVVKLCELRSDMFKGIGHETLNLSEREFFDIYFGAVLENHTDSAQLLASFRNLSSATLDVHEMLSRRIADEKIRQIERILETAEYVPYDNAKTKLEAAVSLMQSAGTALEELLGIIGKENALYAMLADKIATEITRRAVCYYNNTEDDSRILSTIELFRYAEAIAISEQTIRFTHSWASEVAIEMKNLPPEEARCDVYAIRRLCCQTIYSLGDAKKLIFQCAPFLGNLKEKIGLAHPASIAVSNRVLHLTVQCVIEVVNKLTVMTSETDYSAEHLRHSRVLRIMELAWEVMSMAGQLPIDSKSAEWYERNAESLKNIACEMGVRTTHSSFRILTEQEVFNRCESKDDYEKYITIYSRGRYIQEARRRIGAINRRKSAEEREEREQQRLQAKREERERQERQRIHAEQLERERRKARLLQDIEVTQSLEEVLLYCGSDNGDPEIADAIEWRAYQLCSKKKEYRLFLKTFGNSLYSVHAEEQLRKMRPFSATKFRDFCRRYANQLIIALIFFIVLVALFLFIHFYSSGDRNRETEASFENGDVALVTALKDSAATTRFESDYVYHQLRNLITL